MRNSSSQKRLTMLSIITVIIGVGVFWAYPFIADLSNNKAKPTARNLLEQKDKEVFQQLEQLNDNTVNLNEPYTSRSNPYQPF